MIVVHTDLEAIATFCDGLTGYAHVELTGQQGRSTFVLMARDYPRPGRRYTNLTTGMEVFDLARFLDSFETTLVRVSSEDDPEQAVLAFEVK